MTDINGAQQQIRQVSRQELESVVNQQLALPMQIFVRGAIAAASVGTPADILLPALARQLAVQLAIATMAPTIEMAGRARKDFKDAFADGLSKVPLVQPTSQMPAQSLPFKLNG